jgi:hypothetical protein
MKTQKQTLAVCLLALLLLALMVAQGTVAPKIQGPTPEARPTPDQTEPPPRLSIAPLVVPEVQTATWRPRSPAPPLPGSPDDPFLLTNFDMRFELGEDDASVYNGYYWVLEKGSWIPGMISNRSWFLASPQHTLGAATYYANGVMEATARSRDMSLEGFVGGVSLISPADIGQTVYLRRQGMDWEGPFLVVDCARRSDMWGVIYYRGEVVEVDFQTAIEWAMVARMTYKRLSYRLDGVEVWKGSDPPDDGGQPIDLRQWWIPRVEWVWDYEAPPLYMGDGQWRKPFRVVVDGAWQNIPFLIPDPETVTPQPITPAALLPGEVCKPTDRACGSAREALIRWGVY